MTQMTSGAPDLRYPIGKYARPSAVTQRTINWTRRTVQAGGRCVRLFITSSTVT